MRSFHRSFRRHISITPVSAVSQCRSRRWVKSATAPSTTLAEEIHLSGWDQPSLSLLPFGLPSPPPLPLPLLPFGPPRMLDEAIASEVKEVESKSVIAGGVTAANLPLT